VRVFFDSNVLIASAISDGPCRILVNRVIRTHVAAISEEVLAELSRKLVGKFKQEKAQVQKLEAYLRHMCIVLPKQLQAPRVNRDPNDDWILAAALEGGCDCILSGDADLTDMRAHKGVLILRPRDFLAFEEQRRYSRKKKR
jgi:putative PIN family toxin of toxin-antitoxin system